MATNMADAKGLSDGRFDALKRQKDAILKKQAHKEMCMIDVKRWDVLGFDWGEQADPQGNYVHYDDYAAMAERLEAWAKKAYLCAHDVAFFSMYNGKDHTGPPKLCVVCSDTFDYASADCEAVLDGHLDTILNIYESDGEAGLIRWVSEQRNMKPLKSVEDMLSRYDELKQQNQRMRAAVVGFVDAFEMDFVLDGEVVDSPEKMWGPIVQLYRAAKAAITEPTPRGGYAGSDQE